jgi:hypothetical protein
MDNGQWTTGAKPGPSGGEGSVVEKQYGRGG